MDTMEDQSNIDEMKQLVIQTLHSKGVLGKIKANLKACVFDVLNGGEKNEIYNENKQAHKIQETVAGQILADLIREYLQFYQLDYTLQVFIPEANLPKSSKDREMLIAEINKTKEEKYEFKKDTPLLLQILAAFQHQSLKVVPHVTLDNTSPTRSNLDASMKRQFLKMEGSPKESDLISNLSNESPKHTLSTPDKNIAKDLTDELESAKNSLLSSPSESPKNISPTSISPNKENTPEEIPKDLTHTYPQPKRGGLLGDLPSLKGPLGRLPKMEPLAPLVDVKEGKKKKREKKEKKEKKRKKKEKVENVVEPEHSLTSLSNVPSLNPLDRPIPFERPNLMKDYNSMKREEQIESPLVSDESKESEKDENTLLSESKSNEEITEPKVLKEATFDNTLEKSSNAWDDKNSLLDEEHEIEGDFEEDISGDLSLNDYSDHTANDDKFDHIESVDLEDIEENLIDENDDEF